MTSFASLHSYIRYLENIAIGHMSYPVRALLVYYGNPRSTNLIRLTMCASLPLLVYQVDRHPRVCNACV